MPQDFRNFSITIHPAVSTGVLAGWLTLAAGLALAGGNPYLPPQQAQIRIEPSATHLTVEGSLIAPVTQAVAWEVLTDHEHFPEFVPGLQSSQVIETRGNDKIIAQRGELTAAGPRLRYDGTLRVTERPGEGMRIQFLTGLFKDSEGEWKLTKQTQGEAGAKLSSRSPGRPKNDLAPSGGGSDRRDEPGAQITYRLRMDMRKSPLPLPLASMVAEQEVRLWLTALASEMERRQANRK